MAEPKQPTWIDDHIEAEREKAQLWLTPERREEMITLALDGKVARDISEAMGAPVETIRAAREILGIPALTDQQGVVVVDDGTAIISPEFTAWRERILQERGGKKSPEELVKDLPEASKKALEELQVATKLMANIIAAFAKNPADPKWPGYFARAQKLNVAANEQVQKINADYAAAVKQLLARDKPKVANPFIEEFKPGEAPVAVRAPEAEKVLQPYFVKLSALPNLDPLIYDAVNAVLERGRASAVVLQRQLGIGYARGIRILDQLTEAGIVGPDEPTGSREIKISRESWDSNYPTAFSAESPAQ